MFSKSNEVSAVRRIQRAILFTSAATLAATSIPLAASAASPATGVKCGQTITKSIRVANDLTNCPKDGLVIGAAGITIDLSGHSITGVNAPGSEGIADDGHGHVRLQNGRISGFFLNGVGLRNAPASSVSHLTIRGIGAGGGEKDASAGVQVKNSPGTAVFGNAVSNDVKAFQSDGLDVLSSPGATVTHNRLLNNAWNGAFILGSARTVVIGNTFAGNKNQGLELNQGSDHSRLAGNYAANNVSSGLVVGAVSGVLIDHNNLVSNGDGGVFMFDLHQARLIRNRATGNAAGLDLEGGQHGSSGNLIASNDTSRNRFVGITVAGSNLNLLTGNVSNNNLGKPGEGGGIVLSTANQNVVLSNVASGNHDVGIGIFAGKPGDTKSNVVARNTAANSRAHGIDVLSGTIDGGGNFAHGNTPAPNCIGVICR